MNHLDIKEGQYNKSATSKNYFWPFPFSMPMRDPYYTGPMSEPVLSPAGGIIMPRRNPYYTKPINPVLNPYNAQYRHTIWPMVQSLPRTGAAGSSTSCPHHGVFCPTPMSMGIISPISRPPYGRPPYGRPPYGRPPYGRPQYGRPPMGRPPMGPMGTPPIGPPPISPMLPPSMNMPPMGGMY